MQLSTLRRIIKTLFLVLILLDLILVPTAKAEDLSEHFLKAKNGEISITELIDLIVEKVIASPVIGPEVNRYKHEVPRLSETAAPVLISKIHKLLLDDKIEQAWAVKSLADVLIPSAWPEGIRISQIFEILNSLESIKQRQDIKALCSINLSNLAAQDLEVLEKIIKAYAEKVLAEALQEKDYFNAIRKIAELSTSFPELALKQGAKEVLICLSNEQNWQSAKWSFDNPVVQEFILDIFQENKEILVKLYKWRASTSLQEGNQNRAAIYYGLLLPQLNETEKVLFRKEILALGIKHGLSPFVTARADELKLANQLTFVEKITLIFRGYYGWLPLLLPSLLLLPLFFMISNKKSSRKRNSGKASATDDEYTRLLKKLNLGENASEGQIKKAFRQLVKEHHPDAHGAGGVVLDADGNIDQKFEDLRKTYDRIMEIRKSWFGAR